MYQFIQIRWGNPTIQIKIFHCICQINLILCSITRNPDFRTNQRSKLPPKRIKTCSQSIHIRTVRPQLLFSFVTFDSILAGLGRNWVYVVQKPVLSSTGNQTTLVATQTRFRYWEPKPRSNFGINIRAYFFFPKHRNFF